MTTTKILIIDFTNIFVIYFHVHLVDTNAKRIYRLASESLATFRALVYHSSSLRCFSAPLTR